MSRASPTITDSTRSFSRKQLQRDRAIESRVDGAIYVAEAAGSDRLEDRERSPGVAWSKRGSLLRRLTGIPSCPRSTIREPRVQRAPGTAVSRSRTRPSSSEPAAASDKGPASSTAAASDEQRLVVSRPRSISSTSLTSARCDARRAASALGRPAACGQLLVAQTELETGRPAARALRHATGRGRRRSDSSACCWIASSSGDGASARAPVSRAARADRVAGDFRISSRRRFMTAWRRYARKRALRRGGRTQSIRLKVWSSVSWTRSGVSETSRAQRGKRPLDPAGQPWQIAGKQGLESQPHLRHGRGGAAATWTRHCAWPWRVDSTPYDSARFFRVARLGIRNGVVRAANRCLARAALAYGRNVP